MSLLKETNSKLTRAATQLGRLDNLYRSSVEPLMTQSGEVMSKWDPTGRMPRDSPEYQKYMAEYRPIRNEYERRSKKVSDLKRAVRESSGLESSHMNEGLASQIGDLTRHYYTDTKPEVVSASDITPTIFRGIRSTETISTQQMYDELVSGRQKLRAGIYGSGIYFTDSKGSGQGYEKHIAASESRLIQADLKPSARIIDLADIKKIRSRITGNPKYRALETFDESLFAAALGYDAIRSPQSGQENYYTVINPGALRVVKQ